MILAHKIALDPTLEQARYFGQASGTARFVWNWGLAEWNRQSEAGEKPNALRLKKQFNAIKYEEFPWIAEIHRDAHAQPFTNLGTAWSRYFAALKAGAVPAPQDRAARRALKKKGVKLAYPPTFKKKGERDAFYVANDKFRLDGAVVILPKVGPVKLREALRFEGKILSGTVSRTADRWFLGVQVEVADATRERTGDGVVGVDLGIKATLTLSTGEAIPGPKPLKKALRRLKIRSRRHHRTVKGGKNRRRLAHRLAKLHARIAHVRADFIHKNTTRLCRGNQTVVIEDLHVKGMLANDRLSRAIGDVGFGEIRRQLDYKAPLFGTRLIVADRWFPSSRLCSACGVLYPGDWSLKIREWDCPHCGAHHDRDVNAAKNLERLATGTALPVASASATTRTGDGRPSPGGKVTPVRDEYRSLRGSGQEKKDKHFCSLS